MNSEQPFPKLARRLMILGLIVPCLLISIPAIVAYRAQEQLSDSFHWVSHTLEVQRELQRLLSLVSDAETGQRGFLLTTREPYLEPYQSAVQEIPHQLKSLRVVTKDNSVQQENLRQLDGLMASKLDFMAQTIALQREGKREAA